MKHWFLFLVATIMSFVGIAQTSESFTNIPTATNSGYFTRTWTGDNNLSWTATDARTDQTITDKAICIRNGFVSCSAIQNGIATLSFKHQQVFSGNGGSLEIRINGTLIGTVSPTSTVATASFNNINIPENCNLEIKQITSGLRISIDDIKWTNYAALPCVMPIAQPSNLSFSAISPTSMTVSFAAATPASNQYLAIISKSNTLGAAPVNGTTYTVDDIIGNGNVTYLGNSLTFNVSDLLPGTTYYFYIFSVSSNCIGGPLYLTASPATGNKTTTTPPLCTAPTGQVANVLFSTISSSSVCKLYSSKTSACCREGEVCSWSLVNCYRESKFF